jgi:outer membrane lipoprotein SlyB
MSEQTTTPVPTPPEKKSVWQKTKDWAGRNPVIAGASVGFAAGTVVPGLGNVVGAVGGAIVGAIHGGTEEKK